MNQQKAGKPFAFRDLPAEDYPFTIEYRVAATNRLIQSQVVHEPGALDVPGLAADYGPVKVRMIFPNRIEEAGPP